MFELTSGGPQIIVWQDRALVLASQMFAAHGVALDAAQVTWIERTCDHYDCVVRDQNDYLIFIHHLPELVQHLGADADTIAEARGVAAAWGEALSARASNHPTENKPMTRRRTH